MKRSPAQSRLHQGSDSQNWLTKGESGKHPVLFPPVPTAPKIWDAFNPKSSMADNIHATLSIALSNVLARVIHKGLVFGNSSDKPLAKSTVWYRDGWVWWEKGKGVAGWEKGKGWVNKWLDSWLRQDYPSPSFTFTYPFCGLMSILFPQQPNVTVWPSPRCSHEAEFRLAG